MFGGVLFRFSLVNLAELMGRGLPEDDHVVVLLHRVSWWNGESSPCWPGPVPRRISVTKAQIVGTSTPPRRFQSSFLPVDLMENQDSLEGSSRYKHCGCGFNRFKCPAGPEGGHCAGPRPGLSCVYRANKDLLAEPTFSSEPRTTDLCSAGSLFLSLLCTRREMK